MSGKMLPAWMSAVMSASEYVSLEEENARRLRQSRGGNPGKVGKENRKKCKSCVRFGDKALCQCSDPKGEVCESYTKRKKRK